MKPRIEHQRRAKLPPILEIDDEDLGMAQIQAWSHPRWSSDGDEPRVGLDDWPAEFDD